MFKKRGKRRKRQNFRETSKDLGLDEDDQSVSKTLGDVKFVQKYRTKNRGIKAGIHEEVEEEEVEESNNEPAAHFLGAYQQGVAENQEDEKEAKHMEMYIEEELRRRRQQTGSASNAGESQDGASSGRGDSRKLDETELMLQKINEQGKISEKRGEENWAAGITEIPLPISAKLRNIEETEKAKQRLLLGKKEDEENGKKKRRRKDGTGGNYSTNFNQHQREYAQRMREKRTGPEKPAERKPLSGDKVPYATDDRVVARFIKRNRFGR
mmetsp:Transcript_3899/g.5575  ORF Transcript_3899/g.5575 Transcript_3899/m.5575 type:complete len:268 (+) Transcript_3899:110-913(+)